MSPARMSKVELATRIALEFNAAFNRHDVAAMTALISDDCVFETAHPAPDGASYSGRDEVARFLREFFRESPHVRIEIEDIFNSSFRCVMRWRIYGADETAGNESVRGVDIFQVKDGFICERLSYVKG
ncbi:MAG: nuclear transport factor 2 family protein [Anaerolineales bacterium]|nr:nuclear transport factor 2 family protein [Anaerolineales bacterium]